MELYIHVSLAPYTRDRMTDMVAGYHQRNERQRWLSFKYRFFDWECRQITMHLLFMTFQERDEVFDKVWRRTGDRDT